MDYGYKTLEECKTDEEFMESIEKADEDGLWGIYHINDVIPYLVAGIKDPEHIQQYLRTETDPDTAWLIEIERVPDVEKYRLISPTKLQSAIFSMKLKVEVLECVQKGILAPAEVFFDLRQRKVPCTFPRVAEIMDALFCDKILATE